jgi:hypothetical protein
MNTIKDRQQDHMCQGGRSVLNVKLRVTEVGAALYPCYLIQDVWGV